MSVLRAMPIYQCHKRVWALKIKEISMPADTQDWDGRAVITPAEDGYAPFEVDAEYCRKHKPEVGGYYVVYDDGYKSYSPAKAFEDGYTRLEVVTMSAVNEAWNPTEQAIQAAGATKGLRITPADIEANIASEHYFTAADGARAVTSEMVDRFLSWKLPQNFHPDSFISFDREKHATWGGYPNSWPTGTNLLTAEQAKAMLEHVLQPRPEQEALRLLTFCVLVLRNGFTVTGESACASPENFNAEIGRRIARENAVAKVWPLMGYELRSQLARPTLTLADSLADLNGQPRPDFKG